MDGEQETGEGNPSKISRREFLKLGGVFVTTEALKTVPGVSALINEAQLAQKETESTKREPTVETGNARYYQFYERHDLGINSGGLRGLDVDVHFREVAYRSFVVNQARVLDLLNATGTAGNSSIRLFPDDLLSELSSQGALVAPEQIEIPSNLVKTSEFAERMAQISSGTLFMAEAVRKIQRLINQRKRSKLDSARYWASLALVVWAASPEMTEEAVSIMQDNSNYSDSEIGAVRRINAVINHVHPEDPIVFTRNIFMARRLQAIAEHVSREKGDKANITYQVGAGHAGIEDFLKLREEFTIGMLSIYPKAFLKAIVDHNGGVDAFCSMVVIPVKENIEDPSADIKTILVDTKLRAYLEARFAKEEPGVTSLGTDP